MVTSLSMRSNQTSKNASQQELRDLLGKSPAAHRFLALFKTPLDNFVGNIGPFTFGSAAKGPMAPDDPGPSHPDRVRRRLASAVSAGISYREPGLNSSLHIAIRQDGANVHLDREGFVTSTNGRITCERTMTVEPRSRGTSPLGLKSTCPGRWISEGPGGTRPRASWA